MDTHSHLDHAREDATATLPDFSDDQLLLASILCRDKPPGLTLDEYAARLLEAHTPPSLAAVQSHRVIDSAAFWNGQAAEYLDQIRDLKAQIVYLKDENERLRRCISNFNDGQNAVEIDLRDAGYLTSETLDHEDSRRSMSIGLKRKLHFHIEDPDVHPFPDDSDQIICGYLIRLRNHGVELSQLPKLPTTMAEIKKSLDVVISTIASLTIIIAKLCNSICFEKDESDSTRPKSRRTRMIELIADRIIYRFLSCVVAFDNICKTISGRKERGKIIYCISDFYRTNLSLLHKISEKQSKRVVSYPRTARPRSSSTRRRVDTSEFTANKQLGRILAGIVFNIDWNPESITHGELLEGIQYSIINHAGRVLSVALFGEVVSDSKLPGHITQASTIEELLQNTPHKSETRYIIQILHNARGGVQRRTEFANILNARTQTTTNEVMDRALLSEAAVDLVGKANAILKNTLVKSVLDFDAGERLHIPAAEVDDVDRLCKDDNYGLYGASWFIGKMWELVGWDLSKIEFEDADEKASAT